MQANRRRAPSRQTGFTLVEIMVGLGIGMLATVVIIQVISVFEAQRRTTSGSADAQTNGGIALYAIARELQMAGYPLIPVTNSPLECATLNVNGVADASVPNRLTPVAITDGVATSTVSASDRITIRYGTSAMGGVPTQITAMGAPTANDATALTNLGCSAGDATLITSTDGTTCALSTASAVAGTTTVTLANTTSAAVGANLACVGAWNEITYAVNPATGNLDRTSVINGVTSTAPSVVGIVNLQVQYGVSATANSNQVTQWVDASTAAGWNAPTVANRNRIKAIRIAVVARNAKIEPSAVTSACSSTTAAAPTGLCAWEGSTASPAPTVDLSAGDANWLRYRYRVFTTIIPLRNVIWSKDTL